MQVKAPISIHELQVIDRAMFRVERSRRVYGSQAQGVRQEMAKALKIHPAQLSRVFSEKRVPVKWPNSEAFVTDVLTAVERLD